MNENIKTNSEISEKILNNNQKKKKTAIGLKLFKDSNLEFLGSFFDFDQIKNNKILNPDKSFNEEVSDIVLFGRSNVGKSSLINALSFSHRLAFTSKRPGCTVSLNFYKFSKNKGLFLVDLPGYGFAKISKDEIKTINQFLENYFLKRNQLKKVYLLIDSKTGVHENDANFIKFFGKNEIPYSIVLTKIDRISKSELESLANLICENLKNQRFFDKNIICVSAKKNFNIDKLRADIYSTFFDKE